MRAKTILPENRMFAVVSFQQHSLVVHFVLIRQINLSVYLRLIGKIKFTVFLGLIQEEVNLKSNLNHTEAGIGEDVEGLGRGPRGEDLSDLENKVQGLCLKLSSI